ncbi:efflux transporter outer membrane subunit [Arenimonas sp.]|uniref:efflux transporter outer membrane subunit n=1 Tax=Arenimonas sp. TaxID=1872635 RepID=UPI0039E4EB75
MRNSMKKSLLAVALTVALFSGVGFAAEAPATSFAVPSQFATNVATTGAVQAEAEFWRGFGDPVLTALVETALHDNHDLRIALSRYDSANALLRGAKLDRLPTITAEAHASEALASADQAPGLARDQRDGRSYDVGARMVWELDFFGRVRKSVDARRADADALAGDLQALQVAIVAEVVSDYANLRGLQARLHVAEENSASQAETLRLVEAGFAAGRGTEFDTSRARAQLASTNARIPSLQADIAATMHHLAVLTGRTPEALLGELAAASALPALPPGVDARTPGELLRRRPDIAAAESRLLAATKRIGVAKADLFPRFTLGGLFGGQSSEAGSLFGNNGETRLVALGIDWSFLDFGRVRARIAAADAQAQGELARYEQTVLRALEETENALSGYGHARREDAQLVLAADNSAQAARLARIRYEAGAADLFEVLDAERSNLQAQDAAAQGRTRSFVRMVDLYKALAGGWPASLPQRKEVAAR